MRVERATPGNAVLPCAAIRAPISSGGCMGVSPTTDLEAPAVSVADGKDPERFMAAVRSGVVIGVVEVVGATSFAVLIFPGNLSRNVPAGIGLALFTAT